MARSLRFALAVAIMATAGCAALTPEAVAPESFGPADPTAELVSGNDAQLLVDGPATHRAMFEAIGAARDHINLQSYIIEAQDIGERLADVLIAKRAAGVRVNLMYDSVGSLDTPRAFFQRLHDAGVAVCEFNPVNPIRASGDWRVNHRGHRKLLVVDGTTAFTGGINISGVYSSGSFRRKRTQPTAREGWRDTHIRVVGPIVADVQRLFLDAWMRQQHCEPLAPARYFPPLAPRGHKAMRLVATDPELGKSETYANVLTAIERARIRAWLTYGYFVPDMEMVGALTDAARRGVDVRLVLPGFSDFWAPLQAGRSHYVSLLEAGVRVYERRDALVHAKTAVIDGRWSTVGSTNLDWRSFVHNYEANVIVVDADFAAQLEHLFQRDVEHAQEITLDAWRKRGAAERMQEWLARQWEYLL